MPSPIRLEVHEDDCAVSYHSSSISPGIQSIRKLPIHDLRRIRRSRSRGARRLPQVLVISCPNLNLDIEDAEVKYVESELDQDPGERHHVIVTLEATLVRKIRENNENVCEIIVAGERDPTEIEQEVRDAIERLRLRSL